MNPVIGLLSAGLLDTHTTNTQLFMENLTPFKKNSKKLIFSSFHM